MYFQNLRYKHKQNIKIPKYKFPCKTFYHEYVEKYILPSCLTAKIQKLEK